MLRVAVATPVELVRVHAVNSPKTRSPELLERLPSRGVGLYRRIAGSPALQNGLGSLSGAFDGCPIDRPQR